MRCHACLAVPCACLCPTDHYLAPLPPPAHKVKAQLLLLCRPARSHNEQLQLWEEGWTGQWYGRDQWWGCQKQKIFTKTLWRDKIWKEENLQKCPSCLNFLPTSLCRLWVDVKVAVLYQHRGQPGFVVERGRLRLPHPLLPLHPLPGHFQADAEVDNGGLHPLLLHLHRRPVLPPGQSLVFLDGASCTFIEFTLLTLFQTISLCQNFPRWINPQFYSLLPTGAVVGLAAAPLWSAKCSYLTQSARRSSSFQFLKDILWNCLQIGSIG